jgi:transmembrane sensor
MADGNDLLRRIGRAAEAIDPAFTARDVERLVAGAVRRARRRTRRRVALGGLGVATGALLLALRLGGPTPTPTAPVASLPPVVTPLSERREGLRLADGSRATPLDAGSALALREDSPRRVILELARGRGRFEVTPRPERQFVVQAGDVTVTVLGTAFTVERVADRIGVTVERGKVMVEWGAGSRRLVAGERGWFPPLVQGSAAGFAPAPVPRTRSAPRASGAGAIASPGARASVALERKAPPALDPPPAELSADAPPEPSRASLAPRVASPPLASRPVRAPVAEPAPRASVEADRDEARDGSPRQEARESAAALLAAADAARLDGRPADGAAVLRRLLREHRKDPRAPLAAFTLGRVLLNELDQPRQAAAAFAEARGLAPHGPFAEDALAREAEAWSAAGEAAEAAARAQDYVRRYPGGRRAAAMRALGGQ